MKLSQTQIAALWISEGGSPRKADLASAVSYAESGGDTHAGNSCCHGIYQFNVSVGVTSMKCALNPVCATRKAISMSKNGRDWSAWEAYTNGSYQQFLGGAKGVRTKNQSKSVLAGLPSDILEGAEKGAESAINPLGSILGVPNVGGLSGIGDALSFFTHASELLFTEQGWIRVGKMVGGSILLFWGLRIIAREGTGTDPVRAGSNVAKKAAEVAGTVAVVK